jgi:protein gp37
MGSDTGIEWTRRTFNPWIGCTKVSAACDHCYAEARMDARLHVVNWGTGNPRKRTRPANWKEPYKWNAEAPNETFAGVKGFHPVFCSSLADVFDNEVDPAWREDLWALIRATPNLTWQLLTKRIGNAEKMLPADWGHGYPNVWLGATVADQNELNRDGLKLLMLRAVKHFFSVEPMLGAMSLTRLITNSGVAFDALRGGDIAHAGIVRHIPGVAWVIAGGESGPNARPVHQSSIRRLRDDCVAADVAFFFKQWGEYLPSEQASELQWGAIDHCKTKHVWTDSTASWRLGKKCAGSVLDGKRWHEFPVNSQQQ